MKELFKLIFKLELSALFLHSTDNSMIKFFRYVFVGGFAFIIDASVLFLLNKWGMYYLFAAACGFIVGFIVNFVLSKKFVFTETADC